MSERESQRERARERAKEGERGRVCAYAREGEGEGGRERMKDSFIIRCMRVLYHTFKNERKRERDREREHAPKN